MQTLRGGGAHPSLEGPDAVSAPPARRPAPGSSEEEPPSAPCDASEPAGSALLLRDSASPLPTAMLTAVTVPVAAAQAPAKVAVLTLLPSQPRRCRGATAAPGPDQGACSDRPHANAHLLARVLPGHACDERVACRSRVPVSARERPRQDRSEERRGHRKPLQGRSQRRFPLSSSSFRTLPRGSTMSKRPSESEVKRCFVGRRDAESHTGACGCCER